MSLDIARVNPSRVGQPSSDLPPEPSATASVKTVATPILSSSASANTASSRERLCSLTPSPRLDVSGSGSDAVGVADGGSKARAADGGAAAAAEVVDGRCDGGGAAAADVVDGCGDGGDEGRGSISTAPLREATDSSPSEETQVDELVARVARENIIRREDVDRKQTAMLKDKLFDEATVSSLAEKIADSQIRICFDGRHLQDILQNGYVHWSQLPISTNTSGPKLFIQRLETDVNVFGARYYNETMLRRAINEFRQNPMLFIQEWNERFGTSYRLEESSDDQAFVQKMLDDQLTRNDRPADYDRGPIFGSLFHGNTLLDPSDGHRTRPATDMSATYAKSQMVLRPELRNRATFTLGDSFDAYPNTYAWKDCDSKTRDSVLFTFPENKEDQNISYRLGTAFSDSVDYIECQLYEKIKPPHIQALRISKSEYPTIEQEAADLTRQYGVPIEIIP